MSSFDPTPPDQRRSHPPVIDISLDGAFAPPPGGVPPIPTRIMAYAALVAILGGAIAIALLALWLALTIIPVVLGAALIAYGVFRVQLWFARKGSLGGKRDVFRP
jgi:hypothetical protein